MDGCAVGPVHRRHLACAGRQTDTRSTEPHARRRHGDDGINSASALFGLGISAYCPPSRFFTNFD